MPALSLELLIALAVVVASSVGFVVIGTIYKWNVLAPGHAVATRILGVCSLLALTALTAYTRRDRPASAALIGAGGVLLAVGYFLLHRFLVRRLRASVEAPTSGT